MELFVPNFMTLKCNIGSNVNLRIGFVKYFFQPTRTFKPL